MFDDGRHRGLPLPSHSAYIQLVATDQIVDQCAFSDGANQHYIAIMQSSGPLDHGGLYVRHSLQIFAQIADHTNYPRPIAPTYQQRHRRAMRHQREVSGNGLARYIHRASERIGACRRKTAVCEADRYRNQLSNPRHSSPGPLVLVAARATLSRFMAGRA